MSDDKRFVGLRILTAAGLVTAAPVISGPIRTAAEYSMGASLALAAVLLFLFFVLLNRWLVNRPLSPRLLLCAMLFVSCAFLTMLDKLYYRDFDGLVSVGGGDAGQHAYFARMFAAGEPGIYQGFTAFYALTYWLEQICSLNAFESFRTAFYLSCFLLLVCLAVLSGALIIKQGWETKRVYPYLFFISLALIADSPANSLLFPIIHYLQADGFYPQFFGLVPLFFCWCLYSIAGQLRARALIIWGGLLLYRYSYGLNLPDFAAASGILLCWDAVSSGQPAKTKLLSCFYLAASFFIAAYLYLHLGLLLEKGGMTPATNIESGIFGTALLSVCLLFTPLILSLLAAKPNNVLIRMCVFAGLFGVVACLAQCFYLLAGFEKIYYFYKYNFHAAVLVSSAALLTGAYLAVLLLSWLWTAKLRTGRIEGGVINWIPVFAAALVIIAGICGFQFMIQGYDSFRPAYRERKHNQAAARYLKPLADRTAWKIIDNVLNERKKRFGGFITRSWPMSQFMNAAHDYYPDILEYRRFRGRIRPNSCVFWSSAAEDLEAYDRVTMGQSSNYFGELRESPGRVTIRYYEKWSKEPLEISYVCF